MPQLVLHITLFIATLCRRGAKIEAWTPKAGDVIVSNWASWIEILWLAFRLALYQYPRTCPTLTVVCFQIQPYFRRSSLRR